MPVAGLPRASSVARVHGVETPIGPLRLSAEGGRLSRVEFAASAEARSGEAVLLEAEAQLGAYFAGGLRRFELPLAPRGTDFQLSVWDACSRSPTAPPPPTRSWPPRSAGRAPAARSAPPTGAIHWR